MPEYNTKGTQTFLTYQLDTAFNELRDAKISKKNEKLHKLQKKVKQAKTMTDLKLIEEEVDYIIKHF